MNAKVNDLDMESNCEPEQLLEECEREWGNSNCGGSNIVHVGNKDANDGTTDVIDAANWNGTFFGDGIALEYTTNSLAYFADGLNIVIDITGTGITDTCTMKIRIPVDANMRDEWTLQSYIKVFWFWKLRKKGYTAIDDVSNAKALIMNPEDKNNI